MRLALVSVAYSEYVPERFAWVRFWPARFDPEKAVACQVDAGQIVGLIAGRRVELCGRDSATAINAVASEVGIPHIVRRKCRGIQIRIREVRLVEIGVGQRGRIELRIREIRLVEIGID